MSRSTTGRHEGCVLGRATAKVENANEMLCKVVVLARVAVARGCLIVLEQPASSLMRLAPRFQDLLGYVAIYTVQVNLGYFGADSLKPVILYSNCAWIGHIRRYQIRDWAPASEGVARHGVGIDGRRTATGERGLKDTQAYPRAFGAA